MSKNVIDSSIDSSPASRHQRSAMCRAACRQCPQTIFGNFSIRSCEIIQLLGRKFFRRPMATSPISFV